jgi:hypothetical protein
MQFNLILSAAMVGALGLASAPAFADDPHDRGHRSPPAQQPQSDRGHAVERQRADAPRAEAPRAQQPSRAVDMPRAQSPRVIETPQAQSPRAIEAPRAVPRGDYSNGRQSNNGQYDGRQYNSQQHDGRQYDGRQYNNGQYDSRQHDGRQYDNRGQADGRRDFGRAVPRDERPVFVSPRYSGSGGYYRPYVFRERTRLNFGIFLGYPVPYTYAYPYPVPVYGYGGSAVQVVVGPGSRYYGGVSLEITPSDAEVLVDGQYAGLVQDFDGTQRPLNVTAGSHRLDVRAPGYEPLAIDVTVNPGEVVPFRGDLQPAR